MNFEFSFLIPEFILVGALVVMLVGELLQGRDGRRINMRNHAWTTGLVGTGLAFLGVLFISGRNAAAFGGTFIVDAFSTYFKLLFAFILMILIPMSRAFFKGRAEKPGEFLLILLSSMIGFFFLASANDLLLMFIGLETITLSFYILASYLKKDLISIEAGLKYLIIGSLASAFVIYGISLIYLYAGSTLFSEIRTAFNAAPQSKLLLTGILFILSGIGFKIASVPFQLWVPDVYEGAPSPVVAYLSSASKAAGFAILIRLLLTAFTSFDSERVMLFTVLAAMTLLYGNLAALLQSNIKRLFGYSSIGHAGYLLMGVAAGTQEGIAAVLFYLLAYALSTLAAFFVITIAGHELESDRIEAYRGFSRRSPLLAATLFIALLSLAGVPPMAGFFGKFLILLAAVRSGSNFLALLGALGVAISLFYYLSIVRVMYFEESSVRTRIALPNSTRLILGFLMAGIFILGLWQAPFLAAAQNAASVLF